MAYVRTPIEFKQHKKLVVVTRQQKKRDDKIKSLLMSVLMTNGINPANRDKLNEAKELLNGK